MIKALAASAAALVAMKASALTVIIPLGAIVVPPTQTSSIGILFTQSGPNTGLYEFLVSQPNTAGVSSFTNSAVGTTGIFDFSSIGLYSGLGTGGALLESGTIVPRAGGTTSAFLGLYNFTPGAYTIAYTGTVSGPPSSVGSSITFALATVPEPASWLLLIGGFTMVGLAARNRRRAVAA